MTADDRVSCMIAALAEESDLRRREWENLEAVLLREREIARLKKRLRPWEYAPDEPGEIPRARLVLWIACASAVWALILRVVW